MNKLLMISSLIINQTHFLLLGSRGDHDNEMEAEGDVSDMAASLSSHQYKSYNVTMVHKIASNVHVQLGECIKRL